MEIPDIEHAANIAILQTEGARLSAELREDQSLTEAQRNGMMNRIQAIEKRIQELEAELNQVATSGDAKLCRKFGTSL